jgi:hypothetical protein
VASLLQFESQALVDGSIDGWPASFIATNYGPQGWALHVAPYSKPSPDGGDDEPSPQAVRSACDQANDALDGIAKASKDDVRRALAAINFKPD